MPKEIEVYYTGTWSTTLEVPDDFDMSPDNIKALIDKEHDSGEFNFQDGGASWGLDNTVLVNDEPIELW